MNNYWNRVIYKIWSPVYDKLFNTGHFLEARKKVFHNTALFHSRKVLVVGVGTGADLELLASTAADFTAIDYSRDMLQQARKKFKNSSIEFLEMDAQEMKFEREQFDFIIGSLILSVVPNADACFREMVRVLKPGGEIILFDKFLPKEKKPSLLKIFIRPVIRLLGTDIGLNFESLLENTKTDVVVIEDVPIMFKGMYRKIVLSKRAWQ